MFKPKDMVEYVDPKPYLADKTINHKRGTVVYYDKAKQTLKLNIMKGPNVIGLNISVKFITRILTNQ